MVQEKIIYLIFPFIFLQTFLIPGFLLSSRLKLQYNIFTILNISICFTLVINYIFVFILVSLNIFNYLILYTILFIELIYIILKFKKINLYFNQIKNLTKLEFNNLINKKLNIFILYLSLITFGIFLIKYFPLLKSPYNGYLQIFDLGDAMAYYSKWSKIWFENNIPETVFVRPQLWPANTSIIYAFYNDQYLEPFAKIIYLLLPFLILFAVLSISLSESNIIFLLSGIISIIYLRDTSYSMFTSGYMEFPLAYVLLTFLSFYLSFFRTDNILFNNWTETKKFLILYAFICLSVLLTKEQGWIIAPYILIFIILEKHLFKREIVKSILIVTFTILIIFLPFYFVQIFKYNLFENNSIFKVLLFDEKFHQGIGHGKNYGNFFGRIEEAVFKPSTFFVFCLLSTLLTKNKKYIVISSICLIYFLLWATFMSMEIRHLWPIYIFTVMFGLMNFISISLSYLKRIQFKFIITFFLVIILLTISLNKNVPTKKNLEKIIFQKILNMKTDPVGMDVEINNYFVKYFEGKKNIKIKTNYTFLNMLSHPVIDNKFNKIEYENPDYTNKTLLKNFNLNDFDYYLLHEYCSENFINTAGKKYTIIKNFLNSNSCILKNDS